MASSVPVGALVGWMLLLTAKHIVADFFRQGRGAVGICGGDGATFLAQKFQDPLESDPFDYGFVGEVTEGVFCLVQEVAHDETLAAGGCTRDRQIGAAGL